MYIYKMEAVPDTVPTISKNALKLRRWAAANPERKKQRDRDYYHNNEARRQYKIEYERQKRARLREERLRAAQANNAEVA